MNIASKYSGAGLLYIRCLPLLGPSSRRTSILKDGLERVIVEGMLGPEVRKAMEAAVE